MRLIGILLIFCLFATGILGIYLLPIAVAFWLVITRRQ